MGDVVMAGHCDTHGSIKGTGICPECVKELICVSGTILTEKADAKITGEDWNDIVRKILDGEPSRVLEGITEQIWNQIPGGENE
jgi:hypothetical protein